MNRRQHVPLLLGHERDYVADLAVLVTAMLVLLALLVVATVECVPVPATADSDASAAEYLRAYDEACARRDPHDENDDEHGLCASAGGVR